MKNLANLFLDCVFPLFCVSCGKEGAWLCDNCEKQNIVSAGVFCCPVCHLATDLGKPCLGCAGFTNLDRHAAIFRFEKVPKLAISAFKYNFAADLSAYLTRAIKNFVSARFEYWSGVEAIAPVPLHPRRLAERGFNQSDVLALALSIALNLPVRCVLKRKKYTKQQVKLEKTSRQKNVRGVFSIAKPIKYKNFVVVDDVFTTGSTLEEAAATLKTAGARSVVGFTWARG